MRIKIERNGQTDRANYTDTYREQEDKSEKNIEGERKRESRRERDIDGEIEK